MARRRASYSICKRNNNVPITKVYRSLLSCSVRHVTILHALNLLLREGEDDEEGGRFSRLLGICHTFRHGCYPNFLDLASGLLSICYILWSENLITEIRHKFAPILKHCYQITILASPMIIRHGWY